MLVVGTEAASAMLSQMIATADAGSGFAKIVIYSGPVPSNTGYALTSQIPILQFTCPKPCATVTLGRAEFNPLPDNVVAIGSGTPTFFRLFDSDNTVIIQGSAGVEGSGANLELTKASVLNSDTASIVYFVVGFP